MDFKIRRLNKESKEKGDINIIYFGFYDVSMVQKYSALKWLIPK